MGERVPGCWRGEGAMVVEKGEKEREKLMEERTRTFPHSHWLGK